MLRNCKICHDEIISEKETNPETNEFLGYQYPTKKITVGPKDAEKQGHVCYGDLTKASKYAIETNRPQRS